MFDFPRILFVSQQIKNVEEWKGGQSYFSSSQSQKEN